MKLSVIENMNRRSFLNNIGRAGVATATSNNSTAAAVISHLSPSKISKSFFDSAIESYNNLNDSTKLYLSNIDTGDTSDIYNYIRNGNIVIYDDNDNPKIVAPSLALIGSTAKNIDFNNPQQVVDAFFTNNLLGRAGFSEQGVSSLISSHGVGFIKKMFQSSKRNMNPFDIWSNLFDKLLGVGGSTKSGENYYRIFGINQEEAVSARDFLADTNPSDYERWGKLDEFRNMAETIRKLSKEGFVSPNVINKWLNKQKQKQANNETGANKKLKEFEKDAKERSDKKQKESLRNQYHEYLLSSPMHQPFESKLNSILSNII